MSGSATTSFFDRVYRTAKLDREVYEEIEADASATWQAALVVVLAGAVSGLVSAAGAGAVGFIAGVIGSLASWSLYAWIVYFLGSTVLKGRDTKADWGQIARTLGFASSPRVLLAALTVSPQGSALLLVTGSIWLIATTVVAIRAALDIGTRRAVVIAVVATVAQALLTGFVLWLQRG